MNMNPINEALLITVIGMITVFFILFLIILIGNVIIRFANKYLPEEQTIKKVNRPRTDSMFPVIEAAIDTFTKGKGKATNIRKL